MATPAATILDYATAVALAVAALAIRWGLHPWLGPMQPFAPGFVVIAWAVFTLGWRPAVLTAVVAYLGGTYLFLQPEGVHWTRPQDIAALLIFSLSAGLIIFIGHRAREAERQLAKANEQLKEADRRKDEFLATLSHELRNPIGVITTAVANMEAGEQDPRRRSTLAIVSRQAAQIRRLVDDLLDVGRITRGRLTLRVAPVDLRNCVARAAEGHHHAIAGKQQRLTIDVPAAPVQLLADAARIVQVLSNLIDNASKYSPDRADISVSVADGEIVTVEVTDSGPGIDPDVLPRVFDIFDQSGSPESEGLGLGLGLCKRIIEMHGGRIEATENPRGQGACFRIALPKNNAPLASDPATGDAQNVLGGSSFPST
jgi:signal transduction histidine kinase